MLVVDPSGGDECPQDWLKSNELTAWADDDDEIADCFSDLPILSRWVSVRARDMTGRLVGLVSPGFDATAVVVDVSGACIESGRDLAEYSWFSEGGGAPVSWGGASRLADLGHGWLMYDRRGDSENETEIWSEKSSDAQVSEAIRRLVIDEEAFVAAAFALEPLDPGGTLSPDAREQWERCLQNVTVTLSLFCSSETREVLRADLTTTSALYSSTRDALREPSSPIGQRLLADLAYSVKHDMPMPLISGAWAKAN